MSYESEANKRYNELPIWKQYGFAALWLSAGMILMPIALFIALFNRLSGKEYG